MREIELNSLKAQLNPHFMFNSMNSIRALVDEDPGLAKTAITQLSTILRSSLLIGKRKTIPLEEELNVVRSYLALESIRYEERLSVNIEVESGASTCHVPPLMLQTLVENAIKHGISKLTKGGSISLNAIIKNGSLYIRIENTGKFERKNRNKESGIGLANTRKRLDLLYGDQADFKIYNANGMVRTEILIPENTEYENPGN
jgi:LytS/YehU family sensor histidine kinase